MQSQLFIRFYEIKKKIEKKRYLRQQYSKDRIIRIVHTYKLFMSLARTCAIFSFHSDSKFSPYRYDVQYPMNRVEEIYDYGEIAAMKMTRHDRRVFDILTKGGFNYRGETNGIIRRRESNLEYSRHVGRGGEGKIYILLIPDLHEAHYESRKDSEANVGKLLANWKYDTPGPLPRSVLSPATNSTYYSTFQVAA